MWFEEMLRKNREVQRRERLQRIKKSRYNKWYGRIRVEGIPQ